MSNNTLCIEDIMNEIRAEIKEKGLNASMLSFEDVPYNESQGVTSNVISSEDEITSVFQYLNNHYNVNSNIQLGGNKFVVFVKRVIRKFIRFYVAPIVTEQNAFNEQTVKVLNYTKNHIDKSNNDNINDLINRLEVLELSHKNLTLTIETLEEENKKLKETLGK